MSRLVFILMLCGSLLAAMQCAYPASTKSGKPLHIQDDSTNITLRSFNAKALSAYRSEADFKYKDTGKADTSGLERFWLLLLNLWDNFWQTLFGTQESRSTMQYFMIALAAGFLIFIVLKVAGIDVVKLLKGESTKIDIKYEAVHENIHEINFEESIQNAINAGNYRLAVRLLYLSCLKQLSDAGMIHWQPEKTNAAYIDEIGESSKQQYFGMLTLQFEYVWYGDFPLNSNSFHRIHNLFTDFKRSLH